jgi:hypothetical protein
MSLSAICKKGYECKWTWVTIQLYTQIQIKIEKQFVVRKDMNVNEHEWLYNFTLRYKLK